MQIDIENLGKRYKNNVWGLREFTLRLQPGVLGLLGPNGAGKSTLMRILSTVSRPTTGTVRLNDRDIVASPDSVREILGYLPQDFGIYPNLNAMEFLNYIGALKGMGGIILQRRIEELLQVANLDVYRKRALGGYSGGMKQRLGIAQALLNDPQLLIVDEPTVGLDPEERARFRHLLSELSGDRIVILSTHIVSDVESSANRIAIINAGSLVTHATPEELLQAARGKVWECTVSDDVAVAMRQRHVVSGLARRQDGLHLRLICEEQPLPDSSPVEPTLEDAYLRLMPRHQKKAAA